MSSEVSLELNTIKVLANGRNLVPSQQEKSSTTLAIMVIVCMPSSRAR
jgi:hypothetical protein